MHSRIKKILIASGNAGKIKEIEELLLGKNIEVASLKDFNIEEPEEAGLTFQENSLLKAKYYAEKTDIISLADDSGLSVKALNGAPGIYSARWAGNNKDYGSAFARILSEIEKSKTQDFSAKFVCNITIFCPKTSDTKSFEGSCSGSLTFPKRGEGGFGYDPIFIPDGYDKTFAEIGKEEKQKISHRRKAFDLFMNWIDSQDLS